MNCNYCGKEIAFKNRRAINPDGSPHFQSCPRGHLFRRSLVQCLGCEVNLERSSYEYINGRIPEGDDYRVLSCPSCNWFYEWRVSHNGVNFGEVETAIAKLDSDQRWRLHRHEIEIVIPEHYQLFLSSLPSEPALPF